MEILKMKQQIRQLIAQHDDIIVTAITKHIKEAKGDKSFYFPAKGIEDTNILIVADVSEIFIRALVELIDSKELTFETCSVFVVIFDGGDVYDLPIVKNNKLQYKTPHWLPLLIKKGINFKIQCLTKS